MSKIAWILAAAVAAPLLGCVSESHRDGKDATAKPAGDAHVTAIRKLPPDCKTSDTECHITVFVGPRCQVKVSKRLYVVAPHPGGVEMVWTINGDAIFPPGGGIDFQPPTFKPEYHVEYPISSPAGVFTPSKMKPMSATQERKHNSGKPGYYYYTVTVRQNGVNCTPYDPGVADQ